MFEVVSALESRKRRKRLRFATFSIAVHALVLGSLVAASLWQVGDITPPDIIPIVYLPEAQHAPAGGGGQAHRPPPASHPAPKRSASLPPILQPIEMPPNTSTDLPPAIHTDDPKEGPDIPGGPPGGPGGPGGGPGRESPCLVDCGGGEQSPIYQPGGKVRAPVGIFQPEPVYPGPARIAHQQGVVILQAIIGTDGAVENLGVIRSVSPPLDEAAVNAVSRWRYTPATLNGRAVRVYLTVTVSFRLN